MFSSFGTYLILGIVGLLYCFQINLIVKIILIKTINDSIKNGWILVCMAKNITILSMKIFMRLVPKTNTATNKAKTTNLNLVLIIDLIIPISVYQDLNNWLIKL